MGSPVIRELGIDGISRPSPQLRIARDFEALARWFEFFPHPQIFGFAHLTPSLSRSMPAIRKPDSSAWLPQSFRSSHIDKLG